MIHASVKKVKKGGVLNPSDDIDDHNDDDHNAVAEMIEYNNQIEVILVLECKLFMSCNINQWLLNIPWHFNSAAQYNFCLFHYYQISQ